MSLNRKTSKSNVRSVIETDFSSWSALWNEYVELSGRKDQTATPSVISPVIWRRFLDSQQPVFALVAEREGQLVGMAQFVFHLSTTRVGPACYLPDLFVSPGHRQQGVGTALIKSVYEHAAAAGASRVYWHTHDTNSAGRRLFDRLAKSTTFVLYTHNLSD